MIRTTHLHLVVENGRLKVLVKMCASIIRHFTMESIGIVEKLSKRNIVSEVIKSIETPLLKHKKCGTQKNQLLYCEKNILRDCDSSYRGYLCSEERFMRIERSYGGIPAC